MKKKTILIIEDEINHYNAIKKVLCEDYEVVPKTNEDFQMFLERLNEDDDKWKEAVKEMSDNYMPDTIICDLHISSDAEKG